LDQTQMLKEDVKEFSRQELHIIVLELERQAALNELLPR
ncbi:hypothetical protein LCGC14_3118120, partial [marine sediment metagenome]